MHGPSRQRERRTRGRGSRDRRSDERRVSHRRPFRELATDRLRYADLRREFCVMGDRTHEAKLFSGFGGHQMTLTDLIPTRPKATPEITTSPSTRPILMSWILVWQLPHSVTRFSNE